MFSDRDGLDYLCYNLDEIPPPKKKNKNPEFTFTGNYLKMF